MRWTMPGLAGLIAPVCTVDVACSAVTTDPTHSLVPYARRADRGMNRPHMMSKGNP